MNDTRTRATSGAPAAEQLTDSLLGAARALEERLEAALHEVELSMAKYELLRQLAENEAPLPLSELAVGQQCARSNITQLVDRLEADGLVRRIDDPSDRRSKRATLTPLGKKRYSAGATRIAQVQAEFASALSDADRKALLRGLAASRGE